MPSKHQNNHFIESLTALLLSKVTLLVCIGILGFHGSTTGQVRNADFYFLNVPSAPLIVKMSPGGSTEIPYQWLENTSRGTIINFQTGCVTQNTAKIEIFDNHRPITIKIGPADSNDNQLFLPRGSHDGYLALQCSAPKKVAVLEVTFADGGRWSIKSN